ncbi:MAG TPA: DUF4919 domain-containing protein [Pyrinomonadaceae bacterium]|nr:DUF4919 domain-containing protein [Pyrinomonadaceae bacterium]
MLLFVVVCVSAQTPQESPKPTEKETQKPAEAQKPAKPTKYDALVEKVKQKDPSVNFTELRHAFYESPNYNPYAPMMAYRPMNAAINQKNYEEALKIAENVLAKNFVEINAHIVAQIAYRETGNTEKAEFHKFMVDGLLNSIKSSVDGKSKEKAFEVISINEEYGLIRSLGLRPIGQALVEDKGHSYDVITVVDPQTNQQTELYFNIDRPFKWQSKH